MRRIFAIFAVFMAFGGSAISAQELIPTEITPIYRRSFTAIYELTGAQPVREAALSPDSTQVAYVRDNNLFVRDLETDCETAITTDGLRGHIINGATDWVYEEEYAFTRAWVFSPDSRQIAYLRFDESRVREFSMMRYDEQLYPEPFTFKYPKAGEENSRVTLHVYDIFSGSTRQIDTGPNSDQYIPRIGWTPAERNDAGKLFFYRINRLQNHFEVVLEGRIIYEESSPSYVERPDNQTVTFIDEDRFIVRNETRTGWWGSYLYSVSQGFLEDLGQNEQPADIEAWQSRVKDGREFFSFSRNTDGESVSYQNSDVKLFGWLLKPAGFDPTRKYPILLSQYSGPGSESVFVERLSAGDRAIYDPLLEAGYVVACVDGRGTGGRGEEFKKCTYGKLGKLETEDQIAAARHLGAQPWADTARIGIYGWSYGGFIALNSILKGAEVFKLAVAVAPVTSWRFYDTIYTEIYNGLPQENPAGYDDNSPLHYAHLLQGKLLLIHGTGDDNVHLQNTLEMTKALVAAGKQFDMMTYTDDNHSMRPSGTHHVREKIVEYVKENL